MHHRLERVERLRARGHRARLDVIAALRERVPQREVRSGEPGVERDGRAHALLRRRPVPLEQPLHVSEGELGLGVLRIGAHRSQRRLAGARGDGLRRGIPIDRARRQRLRHGGPRQRVVRIDGRRPLVVLDRAPARRRRPLVREVPPAQVEMVGVGALRLPPRHRVELCRRQAQADLFRDRRLQLQIKVRRSAAVLHGQPLRAPPSIARAEAGTQSSL